MREMALTEFLLARIAEDKRKWGNPASVRLAGPDLSALVLKVRAECEAKRRIVEEATNQHTSSAEGYEMVRILATIYADHPDYREEWRP